MRKILDEPHYCGWIQDSMTILCDGNVTCGLDDPHGLRTFGNIRNQSIAEIWCNKEYKKIRKNFTLGKVCLSCSLYSKVNNRDDIRPVAEDLPSRIILETTIKCNLRCTNSVCNIVNNPDSEVRQRSSLKYSEFTGIIDQLKNSLKFMYFLNYGDPFIHPQAEDMLIYSKHICPDLTIVSSTNGIPLSKRSRARKVVESGLNVLTFTIGGCRQDSYEKYHKNGNLQLALQGLRNVCEEKKLQKKDNLKIVWRYLTFRWNDSFNEIEEAKALGKEIGVDELSFYLTNIPPGSSSYRLSPGSPYHSQIKGYSSQIHGMESIIPDESGFFSQEVHPEMGSFRWTTDKCKLSFSTGNVWLSIDLSGREVDSLKNKYQAVISTDWGDFPVTTAFHRWQRYFIFVPEAYRTKDRIKVLIKVLEPWFPAKMTGNDDIRYLGIMLREPSTLLSENSIFVQHSADDFGVVNRVEHHAVIGPSAVLWPKFKWPLARLILSLPDGKNKKNQTWEIKTPWNKNIEIILKDTKTVYYLFVPAVYRNKFFPLNFLLTSSPSDYFLSSSCLEISINKNNLFLTQDEYPVKNSFLWSQPVFNRSLEIFDVSDGILIEPGSMDVNSKLPGDALATEKKSVNDAQIQPFITHHTKEQTICSNTPLLVYAGVNLPEENIECVWAILIPPILPDGEHSGFKEIKLYYKPEKCQYENTTEQLKSNGQYKVIIYVKSVSGVISLPINILISIYNGLTVEEMHQEYAIEFFYQSVLERDVDEKYLPVWKKTIKNKSISQVFLGVINSEEFTKKNLNNTKFIIMLYKTLFKREADIDGFNNWLIKLNNNEPRIMVVYAFLSTNEFARLFAKLNVTAFSTEDIAAYQIADFVKRLYNQALNRQPDMQSYNDWNKKLLSGECSGGDIALSFFSSVEFSHLLMDDENFIDTIYRAIFGRESEDSGKAKWLTYINHGFPRVDVLKGIIYSQEFSNMTERYGIRV